VGATAVRTTQVITAVVAVAQEGISADAEVAVRQVVNRVQVTGEAAVAIAHDMFSIAMNVLANSAERESAAGGRRLGDSTRRLVAPDTSRWGAARVVALVHFKGPPPPIPRPS
jgi:hypothetical protein